MGADLSSSSEDNGPIAGINVTPFVDVVLVLLVIFMITAPILVKDSLDIHLPKAASADHKIMQSLGIAVTQQGQFLFNGQLASDATITSEVKKSLQNNPETQALISADTNAKHGDVVRAIDLIRTAGLTHFAIQIDKP